VALGFISGEGERFATMALLTLLLPKNFDISQPRTAANKTPKRNMFFIR
jgi:hypothetical protein